MKVTSLRYLDAKFHHPSLGASPPPPLRRTVFACLQNCYSSCISCSRSALRYDSINNNLMNYSWTNGRLAIPAPAGLLVPRCCGNQAPSCQQRIRNARGGWKHELNTRAVQWHMWRRRRPRRRRLRTPHMSSSPVVRRDASKTVGCQSTRQHRSST